MQGFALYPFDPPGDVAALRADLRAWLAANQPTADIVARANCWASFDPDFSRALGAAGYVGMTLPARYGGGDRSEEHTSELQSLMRNSYAVLCLEKKKKH